MAAARNLSSRHFKHYKDLLSITDEFIQYIFECCVFVVKEI